MALSDQTASSQDVLPNYDPLLWTWNTPKNKIGSYVLTPNENGGSINIFDNFDWTLTPSPGRNHIPRIILTEYRQTQSSELRGYLYSARGKVSDLALAGAVGAAPTAAFINQTGALTKTLAGATSNAVTNSGSVLSNSLNKVVAATSAVVDSGATLATNGLRSVQDKSTNLLNSTSADMKQALDPYYGLYAVETTGFSYTFPFFSDTNMMSVSNGWGTPSGNFLAGAKQAGGGVMAALGALGVGEDEDKDKDKQTTKETSGIDSIAKKGTGAVKGLFNVAGGLEKMALAATAGAQTKQDIKAFTGSTASDSVQVTFYLYNTFADLDANPNSLRRNWEFCYLFTYQNLPNRLGINLLDAPCLYSVTIPGFTYMPLATLESLSISNVGNLRLVDIITGETVENATNVSPTIKMMPEAYKVTMTLKSVLWNTRNLFLHNADPGQSIVITVNESSTIPPAGTTTG